MQADRGTANLLQILGANYQDAEMSSPAALLTLCNGIVMQLSWHLRLGKREVCSTGWLGSQTRREPRSRESSTYNDQGVGT